MNSILLKSDVFSGVHFSLDGVLYLSSVEYLDLSNPEKAAWKLGKPMTTARAGLALFGGRLIPACLFWALHQQGWITCFLF